MDKRFLTAVAIPVAIWIVVIIVHAIQGRMDVAITLAIALIGAMGLTVWAYQAGRESVRRR